MHRFQNYSMTYEVGREAHAREGHVAMPLSPQLCIAIWTCIALLYMSELTNSGVGNWQSTAGHIYFKFVNFAL